MREICTSGATRGEGFRPTPGRPSPTLPVQEFRIGAKRLASRCMEESWAQFLLDEKRSSALLH